MPTLIESQRRRLLRHGFIFLFVALWMGIATAVLPHPRAWMAAHLTALFTCLILVAIGLVWRELRLTARQRSVALITGLTAAYLGLVGNIFTAVVDLPGPASQPGVPAPMPEAAIFFTLFGIVVPTTLLAFGLVMYGMRGEPMVDNEDLHMKGAART
jgi:hydroxylaminobenzene mutase